MRKSAGRPRAETGGRAGGRARPTPPRPLFDDAGMGTLMELAPATEEAWIEVIQKMDAVYADLVEHQVALERKNAALEEAQIFIDGVLAAMTDVLIVCDKGGAVERVNAAVERLTGRRESDLLGAPLVTLFGKSEADVVGKLIGDLRDARSHVADLELSLEKEDGRKVPLTVSGAPRLDHKGRIVGLVLIGRPVGELKRAYEKLRQTQQQLVVSEKMAALGRLVAGVAHELNNPISFVFGNMHALKRYGERLTQYLQAIDRGDDADALQGLRKRLKIDRVLSDIAPLVEGTLEGAERVSEIVKDLRRFASTQSEPDEALDLVKVVHTAVSWVLKAARVKPVVVLDGPAALEIVSRRGPVHQIVVNLVQNAVDVTASMAEPRIAVAVDVDGGHAEIRVRDNGPGIDPAAMSRLFEPFNTTKPIGEGTGLGLYVSYGLAEELGGTLAAGNDATGGALFTLRLPIRRDADAAR